MATLERWGLEELDKLCTPKEKWRLDLLLQESARPGRMSRFESLDACWREDLRRAQGLRRLPKSLYKHFDGCDPLELAAVLSEAAKDRRIARCAASAAYMRDRRLALLGSILQLIDNEPQTELAFVSISHMGWYFTPRYNWRILSSLSEHVLDLFEDGPLEEPGFFIGFITGRYEPKANNIQLYLNGICAGKKVAAFRTLTDDFNRASFYYESAFWEVSDLIGQTLEIMPRGIMEFPEDINERNRRMREPYHSVYLVWLAHHSLSALVVANDVAVNDQGGLIVAADPLPTETSMPSFKVSSGGRDGGSKIDWSEFVPVR